MLAVAGFGEEEGGAAADHILAVVEEGAEGVVERELLGLAVVDGQEDHGEAFLHLGVLVELVEDDLGLGAALEADVDAHAVAVGFVAELVARDVGDDAFVDELGDALDEPGFVDLVGNLADDDGFAAAGDLLHFGAGADDETAAAGAVGVGDLGAAEDDAAGGEVGAEDVLEGELEVGFGLAGGAGEDGDGGVEDFREVVRGDVGGHAHRDTGRPIDDEVGDAGGQNGGLERGLVVVGDEVDGVHVDVGEHFSGEAGEARLGVAHGGGGVAVNGAEVALAVDHQVAQAEGLGEADHGVVDGGVAMRVVVAHDVTDDLGRLGVLFIELQAHLLHAVEDAAMDGLEAVANVGQGAPDDDRHAVVEVGPAHLFFNVDGEHVERAAALHLARVAAAVGRGTCGWGLV